VMTHDAEDLIHPESLRLINWYARSYDMIQMPVLPLPTGGEWTHGLYCDEFAEFQVKDIPVRQRLRGFLPSNGVGAGFSRDALDRLAATRNGQIFDPACLTEDYENGYRLHTMSCRQIFLPVRLDSAGPVATREYFPRRFRQAVRQRSRWVAGICLQSWQRHGWRAPWRQVYWLWRDRKGLVGNLLAGVANLFFLYTFASLLRPQRHFPMHPWVPWICAVTVLLALFAITLRIHCSARIYGWRFAVGVPFRAIWGNLLNCFATALALSQFLAAWISSKPLAWRKTEHLFPAASDTGQGRPLLGELLVSRRWLTPGEVETALEKRPRGLRLGEYLIRSHKLTEESLYQALSLQTGIPLGMPSRHDINRLVTRTLPAAALRRWKVMPYRVAVGHLYVLTSELPTPQMTRELSSLSCLEIRYRLVRPHEIENLAENFLPKAG
jgi:bacteriophage N4 adsorption protein B